MRAMETLLILFAAIYVVQLIVAALMFATVLMLLWCLYKRPGAALLLGAGVLLVAFLTTPVGLAVTCTLAIGFACYALIRRIKARGRSGRSRTIALLPKS